MLLGIKADAEYGPPKEFSFTKLMKKHVSF